jgi:hypothetical protein
MLAVGANLAMSCGVRNISQAVLTAVRLAYRLTCGSQQHSRLHEVVVWWCKRQILDVSTRVYVYRTDMLSIMQAYFTYARPDAVNADSDLRWGWINIRRPGYACAFSLKPTTATQLMHSSEQYFRDPEHPKSERPCCCDSFSISWMQVSSDPETSAGLLRE